MTTVFPRWTSLLLLALAGCALNPARGLVPTSEEPEIRLETAKLKTALAAADADADERWGVAEEDLTAEERAERKTLIDAEVERRFFVPNEPDIGPFRGAEKLDEQDFYSLVEDRTSANGIAASRGFGQFESVTGLLMAIFGYGTAVAVGGNYALSANENSPVPRIITSPIGMAVMIGAGLAVGALGTFLIPDGQRRTQAHVFSHQRAVGSLEEFRYGAGGLTPATISAIQVTSADGTPPHFCATDEAELKLVALDKRGRKIILEGRSDWFGWVTTPEDLFTHGEEPDQAVIRSPLGRSLTAYGKDLSLLVTVNGGSATFSATMPHDFECAPLITVKGRPGEVGDRGGSGSEGRSGKDGIQGQFGYRGANFEVEAARVQAPDGKRFVLIAIQQEGAREARIELVKEGGKVEIETVGGLGGHGGRGGSGGRGRSGGKCQDGATGGDGGDGGDGGTGGQGGDVIVRLADVGLRDFVTVVSRGGDGGFGGAAGSAGSGGSPGGGSTKECGSSTKWGKGGRSGSAGDRGRGGAPGRVSISESPASQMSLIDGVLSGSSFTLDGAASDTPARKKKKR